MNRGILSTSWLTGKVYELMYWICRDGLVLKEEVLPVNSQKNLERLRGIMEYVREHYTEPVTQGEVARRFYFTREYFSRFFKKNTGLTFKEYLTRYRVNAARDDLLNTDKTILEIAVNHGFADARGLSLFLFFRCCQKQQVQILVIYQIKKEKMRVLAGDKIRMSKDITKQRMRKWSEEKDE